MSYTQSLIKGNQTLTKKVETLLQENVQKDMEITDLRLKNRMLERKLELCEEELDRYKKERSQNTLSRLFGSDISTALDILKDL